MSIKIMSWVWENGPEAQADRFVLLALADYANDEGECWPSISGIARKTCLTARGVQKIIRRLQDTGWLEIVEGGGRKNCHLFRVKTLNVVHPEHGSPLNVVPEKGERGSINPEHGSPEPSLTTKKRQIRALRFNEFWEAYPHRGGVKRERKTSEQKYEKAVRSGVQEQTLIEAAKALHRDKRVIEGYAKDPATWLNKEGWNDGIEAASAQDKDDPINRWKRIAAQ